MPVRTDLLVIGAGPYAYATAAYAGHRGIDTHVVGLPMAAWRDHIEFGRDVLVERLLAQRSRADAGF